MKRQAGDRFRIWFREHSTGVEQPVQIGGWEDCTWPYRKQAAEYAQEMAADGQGKNGEFFVKLVDRVWF